MNYKHNGQNQTADVKMPSEDIYQKAKKVLEDGGVIVFPTETVYGIGASVLSDKAIRKLYKAKNRPLTQKIGILVGSIEMLEKATKDLTKKEKKLIKDFFPGPLTLVLHKNKDIIPDVLTNNEDVVGFRMPQNEIILHLINELGTPLAQSSANKAGEPNGTNIEDIKNVFKDEVDFYIDGGESKIGFGSTVVQIVDDEPVIIREGIITKDDIEKSLSEIE